MIAQVLTKVEAAEIAKVHPATIDKAIRARALAVVRIGNKVRIRQQSLSSWLKGSAVVTREEAAEIAKVHICTIDKAIRAGDLAVTKIGRSVRISRESLDAWLVSLEA